MKELKAKIEKIIFKKLGDQTRKLIKEAEGMFILTGRKEAHFKIKGGWTTLDPSTTLNFYTVFEKEIKKEAEWKKIHLLKNIKLKKEKSEENKKEILKQLSERAEAICYITDCIIYENLAYDLVYDEKYNCYKLNFLEGYSFEEVEDFKNFLLG